MRTMLPLAIVLLAPTFVHAHAIGVEVKLRGKMVEVEVFYDDDTPGAKARVEVIDAAEKMVGSGSADEAGRWSFALPAPGRYEVRVDAGAGHRAAKTITVPGAGNAVLSDGPTRAEFTSVSWAKLSIGIGVIGGCAGAFLLVSLVRRPTPSVLAADATASSQCTARAPRDD